MDGPCFCSKVDCTMCEEIYDKSRSVPMQIFCVYSETKAGDSFKPKRLCNFKHLFVNITRHMLLVIKEPNSLRSHLRWSIPGFYLVTKHRWGRIGLFWCQTPWIRYLQKHFCRTHHLFPYFGHLWNSEAKWFYVWESKLASKGTVTMWNKTGEL